MSETASFAWYRLRATVGAELSAFVSIVILVGALGGLSMGAVAAARSTESSFSDFVASTHIPQLFVFDGVINPGIGLDSAYNPALLHQLSRLPHVEHVESTVELNMGPMTPNGHPITAASGTPAEATVGGLDYTVDRLAVLQGRLPDPHRADEFAVDQVTATMLHYHVGQVIPMGWVTNTQSTSGNFTPNSTIPVNQRVQAKLVGIVGQQATTLFRDQDDANGNSIMLFSPALTNKLLACCSNDMLSALTLREGNRYLAPTESAVRQLLPKGLPFVYVQLSSVEETANDTLRPEAIALGVFGGIAGVATLLVVGQVVSRRIRLRATDLDIVRALGADRSMILADDLIGPLAAVLGGSVLAGLVALALSPLAPLGPVRSFLGAEVHADWAVIGLGVGCLIVALSIIAVATAVLTLPGRARAHASRVAPSWAATGAIRAGMPPAAVTGVRFALEPGAGRTAVPVRSAILGAIIAVTVVVATVTFGSSLNTLVSHPALYGWNWTYDMDGGGGLGDIPGSAATKLLDADPLVSAWSGIYYSSLQFDGQTEPVMGSTPGAAVAPPVLSGHALARRNQVVLGSATLRQLHKQVGDRVLVQAHGSKPVALTIVGTATLPPIGVTGSSHLEMGTGADLAYTLIPPAARNLFAGTPGPNAILVRTKGGASPRALRSLQAIGAKLQIAQSGGSILPVLRPAEILNYGSLGSTPMLLGGALAVGAATALGITLVTSVRRRRRDLAILKTLGFTRRQLGGAVAVQAGVAALIGCVVGIPAGIALGRVLWNLFANQISAVPVPTVPAGTILVIGIVAVVLAVLVATIPGRLAARTPTSRLLRVE
jgi:ABC-type antimicrobial peptide transport system permease subunit